MKKILLIIMVTLSLIGCGKDEKLEAIREHVNNFSTNKIIIELTKYKKLGGSIGYKDRQTDFYIIEATGKDVFGDVKDIEKVGVLVSTVYRFEPVVLEVEIINSMSDILYYKKIHEESN